MAEAEGGRKGKLLGLRKASLLKGGGGEGGEGEGEGEGEGRTLIKDLRLGKKYDVRITKRGGCGAPLLPMPFIHQQVYLYGEKYV